jgi:hypothetical protein
MWACQKWYVESGDVKDPDSVLSGDESGAAVTWMRHRVRQASRFL